MDIGLQHRITNCEQSEFELNNSATFTEHDPEIERDLDNMFFSINNIKCKCYSEDEYRAIDADATLSIIHFK